jgi:hypothetical protein
VISITTPFQSFTALQPEMMVKIDHFAPQLSEYGDSFGSGIVPCADANLDGLFAGESSGEV